MALPDYLEDTAKDYAKQSVATYSAPIETSTFTGGLDASGQRAAGAGITGVNPFVAGMDPMQTQAMNLATQGVGSYSPYLPESLLLPLDSSRSCWTVRMSMALSRITLHSSLFLIWAG